MSNLYTIREVKLALGVSYNEIFKLIKSEKLRAYRFVGDGPVPLDDLDPDMQGLRFRDGDVEDLLEASLIK
jgi:hypothetical protein